MGLKRNLFSPQPNDELICGVCSEVLYHAKAVSCGHYFCTECVDGNRGDSAKSQEKSTKIRKRLRTCPTCKAAVKNESHDKTVPAHLLIQLGTLNLMCPAGCGAVLSINYVDQHQRRDCQNSPQACPNAQSGCTALVTRQNVEIHMDECPYRKIKCSACGQEVIAIDQLKHEVKKRCAQKAANIDRNRSVQMCHSQIRDHQKRITSDLHKVTSEARRIVLHNLANRGIKGFHRFGPDGYEPLLTGRSPRSVEDCLACSQCQKPFQWENNHETACMWHAGPFVETFGGVCLACGKLSHELGCLLGHHQTKA